MTDIKALLLIPAIVVALIGAILIITEKAKSIREDKREERRAKRRFQRCG